MRVEPEPHRFGLPIENPNSHQSPTSRFWPARRYLIILASLLGVALTGSDTSSNALFGSLQRITSQQLGIDPVLMCAANSAGGVMGKMVDAQSITIATAATEQVGNEGTIFRFVVWHSVALGAIVGIIVMLYAYVFSNAVPHGLTFVK